MFINDAFDFQAVRPPVNNVNNNFIKLFKCNFFDFYRPLKN